MTAAITTFIIIVTLFGAGFILWGVWAAIMGVYYEFSDRKRKAMATPMEIDELMLRRLKRSVATRIRSEKWRTILLERHMQVVAEFHQ